MLKFGAISWKINILPVTALLKFESENPFAHNVTNIIVIIFLRANVVSIKSIFRYVQISLPNFAFLFFCFLFFFFSAKSHSVTQRSVSQENDFKKSEYLLFFFAKLQAQVNLLL